MKNLSATDFGSDFTWGVASASYQIEGGAAEDGKGPSIWDSFSHSRGFGGLRRHVRDNDNGDVACDFYHRYGDDLALVPYMNFAAKRFSVSWPRVLPEGVGRVNDRGIDFYSRVVDRCLELGIEPWVTLYHWDLPQKLQDRGGWANRDVVGWFADYVGVVAEALGDRVRNWMVFNEPLSFLIMGNLLGEHAPGIRSRAKFLASMHHVNLAAAAAAEVLRSVTPASEVGTTHYLADIAATGEGSRHVRAVRSADAFINRAYIEPNLGLGYPVDDCGFLGPIEKCIRPGDDQAIKVDWDFLGVQYYTRFKAPPLPVPGLGTIPMFGRDFRRFDLTATGWEVNPSGLRKVLTAMHAYGRFPKLVVTENGAAYPDELVHGPDGDLVDDPRRILFYKLHLAEVLEAIRSGVPVSGYFAWCLTDNFEWADGYLPRFGLVHVDYPTQKRTVKESGKWFREFLGSAAIDSSAG